MPGVLKVGDLAPGFDVQATDGTRQSMSALQGSIVVMFFFPAAFTPGCTKETGSFRDITPDLERLGAKILGISTDDHQTQCDFAASMRAQFPMIGDDDLSLSRKFDVLWPLIGRTKRVTYVIDREGRVAGAFHHEVMVGQHITDVLKIVRRLSAGG